MHVSAVQKHVSDPRQRAFIDFTYAHEPEDAGFRNSRRPDAKYESLGHERRKLLTRERKRDQQHQQPVHPGDALHGNVNAKRKKEHANTLIHPPSKHVSYFNFSATRDTVTAALSSISRSSRSVS